MRVATTLLCTVALVAGVALAKGEDSPKPGASAPKSKPKAVTLSLVKADKPAALVVAEAPDKPASSKSTDEPDRPRSSDKATPAKPKDEHKTIVVPSATKNEDKPDPSESSEGRNQTPVWSRIFTSAPSASPEPAPVRPDLSNAGDGSRGGSDPNRPPAQGERPGQGYRPPRSGNGDRGQRGGDHWAPGPGRDHDRGRGPGWWRGRHREDARGRWRYHRYRGSWHFLWHCGPVILPVPIFPAHVVRIPHYRAGVYVRYTGEDDIGDAFVTALTGELRAQGLRQVWSASDAVIELYVVSMDETPEDPGYYSAVSVSYISYPGHRFITAQLLDVGGDQVDDLAETVAEYTDDLVDDYR
jgi:hypothetical protein